MRTSWLLLLHFTATWYMVGLIWMVQIVHYKLFDRVGVDGFDRYASDHSRLITPIVGIPMFVELVTAIALVAYPPNVVSRGLMAMGLTMVILLWLSTAFVQVPCHQVLGRGFDQDAYARLVRTNWIRTMLWTARGILVAWVMSRMLAESSG